MASIHALLTRTRVDPDSPVPPQNAFILLSKGGGGSRFAVPARAALRLSTFLNTLCRSPVPLLTQRSERAVNPTETSVLANDALIGADTSTTTLPSTTGAPLHSRLLAPPTLESPLVTPQSPSDYKALEEADRAERAMLNDDNNNTVILSSLSDDVDDNGNILIPLPFDDAVIAFVSVYLTFYGDGNLPLRFPTPFNCRGQRQAVEDSDEGPFHQYVDAKNIGLLQAAELEMFACLLQGDSTLSNFQLDVKSCAETPLRLNFVVQVLHCASYLDIQPLQQMASLVVALSIKGRSPKAIECIFAACSS